MNYNDTNDWRTIAHEEYEKRKNIELQHARITNAIVTFKQSLTTSNNYNTILEKKLAELERKCAEQEAKLNRSIELLKNAKLLINKRKIEIADLTSENLILNDALYKKSAMLEAEMQQHDKTNQKLAQALSKLAAMTTTTINNSYALPPPVRTITSPDVIYAEAAPQEEKKEKQSERPEKNLFQRLFAYEPVEPNTADENPEIGFIEQMRYIEKQYSK